MEKIVSNAINRNSSTLPQRNVKLASLDIFIMPIKINARHVLMKPLFPMVKSA